MNRIAFYDTETTGLPLWRERSADPRQPHIVQICSILVDANTREEVGRVEAIIKPDGWVIPPEMTAIHGISQDMAMSVGRPAAEVAMELLALHQHAELRVAHNEGFDARMVKILLSRVMNEGAADSWSSAKAACTQRLATPILNLPPTEKMIQANMRGPKAANMSEAYRYFFGHDFEGAHGAPADAQACRDVYFAIMDYRAEEAAGLPLLPPVAAPAPKLEPTSSAKSVLDDNPF